MRFGNRMLRGSWGAMVHASRINTFPFTSSCGYIQGGWAYHCSVQVVLDGTFKVPEECDKYVKKVVPKLA